MMPICFQLWRRSAWKTVYVFGIDHTVHVVRGVQKCPHRNHSHNRLEETFPLSADLDHHRLGDFQSVSYCQKVWMARCAGSRRLFFLGFAFVFILSTAK